MTKKKRSMIILIIIALAVAVIAYAIWSSGATKNQEKETVDSIYGDESLGIDPDVDENLRDYRNILIFGLNDDENSKIIMLVSINKDNELAKLVTIHSETYFKSGEAEDNFISFDRAYSQDGFYGAVKVINANLKLNCHEGVVLNFDTVEKLVDGVGGLDVYVSETVRLEANSLIDNGAVIKHSGNQKLNGAQAVGYLRTKGGDTSVQREKRKEDAFAQIFDKAKKMSNEERVELLDEVYEDIDSNMSNGTITKILNQLDEFKLERQESWPYEWSKVLDKKSAKYYFLPETLDSNVTKLHEILFEE